MKTEKIDKNDVVEFVSKFMKKSQVKATGISATRLIRLFSDELKSNRKFSLVSPSILIVSYKDGDKDEVACRALINMIAKHCKVHAAVDARKHHAILIGKGADEISSKMSFEFDKVVRTKKTVKIPVVFPYDKKMKCFGGAKVSDEIKRISK